MTGLNPHHAGISFEEIIFCQLSPLHLITLDPETKAAANIPATATYFAWAYPVVMLEGMLPPRGAAEAAFMEYGGYIYFNNACDVVGTNSIMPAPVGTLGLMFGRAQPLSNNVADMLMKQGRFQEITLAALADKGATHFAWIRPGEFATEVASTDGCFAYMFRDDSPKYFPVVSKPVFTKELIAEELEDTEAWVVFRTPTPSVEVAIIFDRSKTLEENVFNNSHGVQVPSDLSEVSIGRDGQPGLAMIYEEWSRSADQGSLADPFNQGSLADPFIFYIGGGEAPTGSNDAEAAILGICVE